MERKVGGEVSEREGEGERKGSKGGKGKRREGEGRERTEGKGRKGGRRGGEEVVGEKMREEMEGIKGEGWGVNSIVM